KAYAIQVWLEFRRVLFRSARTTDYVSRARCTGSGNALDRHRHLLRAGNVIGRPSAFHVAAATAAKTASLERARAGAGSSTIVTEDRKSGVEGESAQREAGA